MKVHPAISSERVDALGPKPASTSAPVDTAAASCGSDGKASATSVLLRVVAEAAYCPRIDPKSFSSTLSIGSTAMTRRADSAARVRTRSAVRHPLHQAHPQAVAERLSDYDLLRCPANRHSIVWEDSDVRHSQSLQT